MIKEIKWIILSVIITSCTIMEPNISISSSPSLMPTVKPSESSIPTVSPTSTSQYVDPQKKYQELGLEVYQSFTGNGEAPSHKIYCENEEDTLKDLSLDMARIGYFTISKDGETAYLIGGRPIRDTYLYRRNYVYTIKNNKASIIKDPKVSSCGEFGKDVTFEDIIGIYYGIINLEKERSTLDGGYYIGKKLKYLDNKVISVDMKPLSKYIFEYNNSNIANIFVVLDNSFKKIKPSFILGKIRDVHPYDYPLVYTNKENKLYFNGKTTLESVKNYRVERSDNIISEYDVETEEIKNIIPEEFYPNTSVKKLNPIMSIGEMITNSKGEIIVLDYKQNRLWKVTPSKKIELLAGSSTGYKDGKSDQVQFDFKYDFGIQDYGVEDSNMYLKDRFSRLEIDKNDNIYVFDKGNRAIRKVTPDGEVTTFYKTSQDEQPIYLN